MPEVNFSKPLPAYDEHSICKSLLFLGCILVSSSGRISDHVDELSVLLQAENLLTS
jgi:hypothetical protein